MLTQLMGGEIGVESEKGAGSRFWFTALFRESEGTTSPPRQAANLTGASVAVVDDNLTNRTILERYLRSWGMRERTFDNGHEALLQMRAAAAGDDAFDLAIIDMMMPGMDGADVAAAISADELLNGTPVILVTSAGQSEVPVAGVDVEIVKPVRPSQLFDAIHALLAKRAAEAHGGSGDRADENDEVGPADPDRQWTRILVVEDNTANQTVVVRMVQRLGYKADAASDGAEAIGMLARIQYDAVLMDCQMPGMDGYEATRLIRRHELPGRHLPIIAMTAAALAGDRERCLAAGMDDYISKPVKLHVVAAVLERWLAAPSALRGAISKPQP
jgi:CheY-like chemotaxis protein